jgi:hypothetical protein
MFQTVYIPELPTAVFPSTVAEIRMDDLLTGTIKKDAFCAMNILSVTVSNASIDQIEPGAFSDRTLIHGLEFVDVRMKSVKSGAFRAGANNLTIQYSRSVELQIITFSIISLKNSFNRALLALISGPKYIFKYILKNINAKDLHSHWFLRGMRACHC